MVLVGLYPVQPPRPLFFSLPLLPQPLKLPRCQNFPQPGQLHRPWYQHILTHPVQHLRRQQQPLIRIAYNIGAVMTPAAVDYPADTVDISGWNRIEGNTAAITIPPSYEVLDFADAFVEMMFSIIEAFAEGFSEFAQDLGEELGATPQVTEEISDLEIPLFDIIIAVEETSQSAIILVNVDRGPETTTEHLINQALTDNEGEFQLVTRELLTNAPYPMERVILDVEDEELGPGKQVIYVILGDQNAWNVIFAAPAGLFDQNLPMYEAAINSFTPLP